MFLQATPIDVAAPHRERLFDTIDTVVLTSATLAVGGNFEYIEKRLGLKTARTLLVPSHFDYRIAGPAVRPAAPARSARARLSPKPPRMKS